MRNFSKLITLALATTLAIGSLAAGNDKQQIRALYTKLKNAMANKDIKAIERLEAPGFTETEMGQTMNAAQANSMMQQQFKLIQKTKRIEMNVKTIALHGKTANVTTQYVMEAVMRGPDSKPHTIKMAGTTAETVVKTGGKWLFQSEKDTGHKAYMDGKPMQGM